MKAVYIVEFGGAENLQLREVDDPPKPQEKQVKVRVRAAGLNRADLLQRRGMYPPPAGYSANIPGLEFAGEVTEVGPAGQIVKVGDRVFGITSGEAQAEYVLTDERIVTLFPDNLTFVEAAGVPEAFITAHDALFSQGELVRGEHVLIHAIGSGVGLAALQLAKVNGSFVIGTSRTPEKLQKCKAFGLDLGFQTVNAEFADDVIRATTGKGVNVILDLVGAAFFEQNLKSLSTKGRLVLVGLTSGASGSFDLRRALTKRLKIIGTVLRSRSLDEKAEATQLFARDVVPLLKQGLVKPNIDRVYPLKDVRSAHEYLESNDSFGKVVLEF